LRHALVRRLAVLTVILSAVVLVTAGQLHADGSAVLPLHHLKGGFRNLDPTYEYPLLKRALGLVKRTLHAYPARGVAPIVVANDCAALRRNHTQPTVTWVGHATLLVQVDGENILTDPIWSDRASPVGFAGPRRLVPPGLRFEDLPAITAVIISHDHYDHLDVKTVERINRTWHPRFFVPLGVKAFLAAYGVQDVVELDWWESAPLRELTFILTPAQHSSGRGLRDQNLRLWGSWVITAPNKRVFFGGDSGYFKGFKEIGERFGPFDLVMLPIGGYSAWEQHPNHLNPEDAVQALEDVRGRLMVPMHFATFTFNREPFRVPPDRLLAEARRRGLADRIALLTQGQTVPW
jgi:N-acyl-phosphatidylethanolamine-hydrolysing phospholipase D